MTKHPTPDESRKAEAAELARANRKALLDNLLRNGDKEMQASPMFRARIRAAARNADYVDFAQEAGLLGEGEK
jgi:hypothetical protein